MELPVCSQEGGHHFSPCLSADSPLPGPYGDLDHPRKHCCSSCPLNCLLILTLTKTNWSQRRSWTPHHTHVVLPGLSPRPPTQICTWIPCCLCHPSFQAQHCSDLLPSWSSPWLLWWDRHPPKLLPWWWHTTLTSTQDGNQLDPVFTSSCSILALSITQLTVSDHHHCQFLSPHEVYHLLHRHLQQPEIPLSLYSLLSRSFLTSIHITILSNVHRGSLLHSVILPLYFFRCSQSPHLPASTIIPPPVSLISFLSKTLEHGVYNQLLSYL